MTQPDPETYTDNETVGRVYDVALNGQGLMLYDGHEDHPDLKYDRDTQPLESQRLATGSTPFNEAIDHYVFTGQSNWTGGAGQRWLDRPNADETAFWDSAGVDPFDPAGLKLFNRVEKVGSYSGSGSGPMAFGMGCVYVAAGGNVVKVYDSDFNRSGPGAYAPADTLTLPTNYRPLDMTGDSQGVYVAGYDTVGFVKTGVYKGWSSLPLWSSVLLGVVEFAAGRVCGARGPSASSGNNIFTTLNDSGAEEVSGGRLILPSQWEITSITGGPGFVWFTAWAGCESRIYKWDTTSATPSIALQLPTGELAKRVFHYMGSVMVRTFVQGTPGKARIYRCTYDAQGNLTPFLVAEFDSDDMWGGFGGMGTKVYWGLGGKLVALDLTTGGWVNAYDTGTSPASGVIDIFPSYGTLCFSIGGDGTYLVVPNNWSPHTGTSGWLKTSISDKGSTLTKVADAVLLNSLPINMGESITADITYDGGSTYTAIDGATLSSLLANSVEAPLAHEAVSLGLRLNLASTVDSSPTLTMAQIRQHLLGLADTLITLPVDCGDVINDMRGVPIPAAQGAGAQRAAWLEGLVGSRVKFQDVTWADTGTSEICDVVRVKFVHLPAPMYDRSIGKARLRLVALVLMRKRAR